MLSTITIPLDDALRQFIKDCIEHQVQQYLQEHLPQPDPQYTCAEVAELLGLDASTVRSYLKLPLTHPRYLPYVKTTDSSHGNRICLSAITAWQQRNNAGTLQEVERQAFEDKMAAIGKRRARRREIANVKNDGSRRVS